jgi:Xaa-Pro aminopeptidase
MAKENIDAFIVPTDDPHMSEYTAPHYMRREFISGFTGSAGTAVITKDNSYLFTDGRYHNQAELELEDDWVLMKQGLKDVPTISELLRGTLSPGATVGVDPLLHSAADVKKMFEVFKDKDIKVSTVTENPVDAVWNSCDDSRPSVPLGKIRVHPAEYAGKSVTEKLAEIRGKMQGKKVGGLVSSALDEIAW